MQKKLLPRRCWHDPTPVSPYRGIREGWEGRRPTTSPPNLRHPRANINVGQKVPQPTLRPQKNKHRQYGRVAA
ncbi:MAG: hypothetical protein J6V54_10090 [Bacteroidales bacterium]|nr:hypothetical protein [Bacteroidales bacterium]